MSLFKLGNVRLNHKKSTDGMQPVRLEPPCSVTLPLSQNIGAPATPCVKVGDTVSVGTVVATAGGYVSAPIHSSVSGKVKKIDEILLANGRTVNALVIESDGLMTKDSSICPPTVTDLDSLCAAIAESGLVGLGGAAFPTHVKLDALKRGEINTVIINGAECEPYITVDSYTMQRRTDTLVEGIDLIRKYAPDVRIYIGIEKNKPAAISAVTAALGTRRESVTVVPLPDTYPQGAEKVLIFNTTGKVVMEGELPASVGAMVINVTTLAFIADYVKTGMPLVEKMLTVDGSAVCEPKNVIAPIGMSVGDILTAAGGIKDDCKKVILGGPMMGSAIYSLDTPIVKGTNAIVALTAADTTVKSVYPCIHCGRCVAACPLSLDPTKYARAMGFSVAEEKAARLEAAKIDICMECGCCSYVCPSSRPLVETNRQAKTFIRDYRSQNKA